MADRPERRARLPWFQLKLIGLLLVGLGATWLSAVYLFHVGVSSSFNLILHPSIATALETAKDRTHDHIAALREQLKWRTERMATEVRRLGIDGRLPGRLELNLQLLFEQNRTAFDAPSEETQDAETGEATGLRTEHRSPVPRLIEVSALDVGGRRVRVRDPGTYDETEWRLKTFRPRPPGSTEAARTAVAEALRAPLLCLVGACLDATTRYRAARHLLQVFLRAADPDVPDETFDAGGFEAVYATPWSLFDSLQTLGDVLDRYKVLRLGGRDISRRFGWVYMILLGVVSILTVSLSLLFARRSARRLGVIARATRDVAGGNLDVRVAASGRDEIAELARSFDDMVADLRESRDRITYLSRVSAWQGIARRLAHEIKNPLTPIQLAIQEVADRYDGADEKYAAIVRTAREVIEEEVATLRRLTTEFSSFARLPQVEPTATDLAEFLGECEAAFSAAAADAGIDIRWSPPDRAVEVHIDRQMMRRVIDNLVRNAVEALAATPGDGEPTRLRRIEVSCPTPKERGTVEILVADTGPGIPDDVREHLFEPYFTTKTTGTGLGLAIVKKIVLEHGGEIRADRDGDRTIFRIRLRLGPLPPTPVGSA